MTARAATSIGLMAVLLWSLLALFTAASGAVPPFQLAAMTFLVGGLVGAASWIGRPGAPASLRQRPAVWALGIGGLFGYHALYFAALRLAPPAEAGLIAYLWPLLIVLFSALLPGERLRLAHMVGALLGFAGVVALAMGRGAVEIRSEHVPGYMLAFACAFVWSGYSVLSRRFGEVPSDAVAQDALEHRSRNRGELGDGPHPEALEDLVRPLPHAPQRGDRERVQERADRAGRHDHEPVGLGPRGRELREELVGRHAH